MRISESERNAIVGILKSRFGREATILLFGSRTDDARKGGDIDLLVQAPLDAEDLFRRKIEALSELQMALGEQKIDLVTWQAGSTSPYPPIVAEALSTGVSM